MNRLKAIEGPLTGLIFTIPEGPRIIVGRNDAYDLVIPDTSLSRKHFAIENKDDGVFLVDLGSLNGTQLNGACVSTARLENNDKIAAGQTVLLFESDDATQDETKAPENSQGSAPTIPIEIAQKPAEVSGDGTGSTSDHNSETDSLPLGRCCECDKLIYGEDIKAQTATQDGETLRCKACPEASSK